MQARRIARELALLSINQLPSQPQNLATKVIEEMVLAAVRSLAEETRELLELASAELQRGNEKMLISETRIDDPKVELKASQAMVREAIDLAEKAINRVGMALEFPEIVQRYHPPEIRRYTVELLQTVHRERAQIDKIVDSNLVDWQMSRLANVDQQILRIAVAELQYLKVPTQVAINEAVELAKRYSTEDGYRFINGVLRAVAKQMD